MRRIAIATGSTLAEGRQMAQQLADRGYSVAVRFLDTAGHIEKASEIAVGGADVAPSAGPVDLVVHDSGMMPLSAITSREIDRSYTVIATDLGDRSRRPAPSRSTDVGRMISGLPRRTPEKRISTRAPSEAAKTEPAPIPWTPTV